MFEIIIQILAGLGLAFTWDKVAPTIFPGTNPPASTYQTGVSTWGPLKIGIVSALLVAGAMGAIWLGRKLHIFKTRR